MEIRREVVSVSKLPSRGRVVFGARMNYQKKKLSEVVSKERVISRKNGFHHVRQYFDDDYGNDDDDDYRGVEVQGVEGGGGGGGGVEGEMGSYQGTEQGKSKERDRERETERGEEDTQTSSLLPYSITHPPKTDLLLFAICKLHISRERIPIQ